MLNKGIEATLLSKEEIGKSKVLQKIGASCDDTYWTRTLSHFEYLCRAYEFYVVYRGGRSDDWGYDGNLYGVRPVLKSDNLNELIKDCKSHMENGIQVIEYGEFPHLREFVKIDDTSILEETGKEYILPTESFLAMTMNIDRHIECRYIEYNYNEQRVVKYNGWYCPVKPIKWYLDEENNMLIAKDILFNAPIKVDGCYKVDNDNYNGSFETSQLYSYLNNEFLKQMLSCVEINRVNADKPDDIALLEAELEKLEEQNQSKKDKINQLEALLARQERLQEESAELDAKIAELTQKLNQKVKK